jgi:hypothetical protein
MRTTYHFYLDPGHGWLKVPRQELQELGIAHLITPYSYQRGDWVFLEEDRDLTTFANAHPKWSEVKQVLYTANNRSRIRGYQRYDPEGEPS